MWSIYKIEERSTGKTIYVGQTYQPESRYYEHFKRPKSSWLFGKEDIYDMKIIEEVITRKQALIREAYWQDFYGIVDGSRSSEIKKKVVENLKEEGRWEEINEKRSSGLKTFYANRTPEEKELYREKVRQSWIKRKQQQ